MQLDEGFSLYRPIVNVEIEGIQFFPIIDSGCDTTVISEEFADAFGIKKREKTTLRAFRETFDVYHGKINIKFIGKTERFDELLIGIPCLIVPKEKAWEEDVDLVLGVAGIFEKFKITFDLCNKKLKMEKSIKNT